MVNDYSKGKIYKIECNITGEVYIGSTTEPTLAKRLSGHKIHFRKWKKGTTKYKVYSFQILERENYSIYLIENYSCKSKDELFSREGHFIKEYKNCGNCVNKQITGRSLKEYYQDNKEIIAEKDKIYKQKNAERYKKHNKEKYEKNKEEVLEQQKIYYEENKERISLKGKSISTCECGCTLRTDDIKRHLESKRHIDLLNKTPKYKSYEKIKCDCGCEIRYDSMKKHKNSKKHQDFFKSKEN
jgi:hypothetical protein